MNSAVSDEYRYDTLFIRYSLDAFYLYLCVPHRAPIYSLLSCFSRLHLCLDHLPLDAKYFIAAHFALNQLSFMYLLPIWTDSLSFVRLMEVWSLRELVPTLRTAVFWCWFISASVLFSLVCLALIEPWITVHASCTATLFKNWLVCRN